MRRKWKSMSNEEMIGYAKKHGLYGILPSRAYARDSGFYDAVRRRRLTHEVFEIRRPSLSKTPWRRRTDGQMIEYAKQNGLLGRSPGEAIDLGFSKFYLAAHARGIADQIFVRRNVNWQSMSEQELIEFGKKNGLLDPENADPVLREKYLLALNKRRLGHVLPKKVQRNEEIGKFLCMDEQAMAISRIYELGYSAEAVRFLMGMWPNRFPNYSRLLSELPKIVPKITAALGPLSIDDMVRKIFEEPVPEEIKVDLSRLLIRIGIDEYQNDFNKNPRRTVRTLQRLTERQENNDVKRIFEQISDFYQGILDFRIPGYGTLEARV